MDFHPTFFLRFLLSILFLSHLARNSFGWRHSRNMQKGSARKLITGGASSAAFDPTRVVQLSWRPRAFLYKNFLTDEECDHLILLAKDKLEKSMVADNDSGKSIESEVRTSSGMFLWKAQDEVVAGIESRIAAWTFLPVAVSPEIFIINATFILLIHGVVFSTLIWVFNQTTLQAENGEAMQILHYEHGQKYEPHYDFFRDKANQELGGHRVATVLMYLSNVERGGETVFPKSVEDTNTKDDNMSDCAKQGHSVKPEKGDALLFFSLHPDASTDSLSLHGSCPVIEGEKWSATKWIHVRSFDTPQTTNGVCADENEKCVRWAAAGECERNPHYMVGSKVEKGFCRKSCNVCSS